MASQNALSAHEIFSFSKFIVEIQFIVDFKYFLCFFNLLELSHAQQIKWKTICSIFLCSINSFIFCSVRLEKSSLDFYISISLGDGVSYLDDKLTHVVYQSWEWKKNN